MTYEEWLGLKPLAMALIEVFYPGKLMYYDEINKCGDIIEILHAYLTKLDYK